MILGEYDRDDALPGGSAAPARRNSVKKRVAIGSIDGPRSLVWKLWTQKNDVYLLARDAGNSMHISFHESGKCHIKTKSSLAESLRSVRGKLGPYLDTWELASSAHRGITPAFHVFVPVSQLRDYPYVENKPVTWLSPPSEGFTAGLLVAFDEINVDPNIIESEIVIRQHLPNRKYY